MNAKRMSIPGSPDFIQLIPYHSLGRPKHFQNLSRCSTSGRIVWTAELPTRSENDAYVEAQIEGNQVIAWSWSCFRVKLNLESGVIEDTVFTK